MMKKIFVFFLTLMSLNMMAQSDSFKVKEDSFRKIKGEFIEDTEDHRDDDDIPMALIKIITKNIDDEQRHKLKFFGNRVTQIGDKEFKSDQVWIYLTAEGADFLEIRHPDFGTAKFIFPERLCDFCTYELVLQYVSLTSSEQDDKNTHLIVKSDQPNAMIYIDGELLNVGEASKYVPIGSSHTYKIECDLFKKEIGVVTVEAKTVIDKKLIPYAGYINVQTTPESGAKVYVDDEYIGLSPAQSNKLNVGSHTVKVVKDLYVTKEQMFMINDGETTNAVIDMKSDFVELTVTTDSRSDIYIDGEYKSKGSWSGRISTGIHVFEAKKDYHITTKRTENIVGGSLRTIAIDSPTPTNNNKIITVKGVSFTMIEVEGGTFNMGTTKELDKKALYQETPMHAVTVSDYFIGETEVTQELWMAVMGDNPSHFKGEKRPVESVSWNDCQRFIAKLNEMTGENFRLPTEAEWEYAAKGGDESKDYKYSGSDNIDDIAWYSKNTRLETTIVKTKMSNELGIYDMTGNVRELCQDWYDNYNGSSQTNPKGPSYGKGRVYRGGSWGDDEKRSRNTYRLYVDSYETSFSLGFRLAM